MRAAAVTANEPLEATAGRLSVSASAPLARRASAFRSVL